MGFEAQAEAARRSPTPWRGNNAMPVGNRKMGRGQGENERRNTAAKAKLSVCELETGRSEAYWDAWHKANRERVLARWGR